MHLSILCSTIKSNLIPNMPTLQACSSYLQIVSIYISKVQVIHQRLYRRTNIYLKHCGLLDKMYQIHQVLQMNIEPSMIYYAQPSINNLALKDHGCLSDAQQKQVISQRRVYMLTVWTREENLNLHSDFVYVLSCPTTSLFSGNISLNITFV